VTFTDEDRWKKLLKDAEGDNYGKAIMQVASQWADLMESQIDKGIPLGSVAWVLFKLANEGKGLSGFQAGCAVEALVMCWKHGETLRLWWNEANEAEALNEVAGAVADPSALGVRAI
jgi:hypothetical protein